MDNIAKNRWRTAMLLAVAALMQLPVVLCGFELCDSGFYLTFYRNIFAHPDAVSYNFMYYLSGVAGSFFLWVTGGSLLGMRIVGAVCNMLTLWFVWWAFGSRRRLFPFLLAAILVCAGSWGHPLTFYNDTLSVLLATISLSLLIKALDPDSTSSRVLLMVFIAGSAAGLNGFVRLPNLLEILFAAIPLIFARSNRLKSVCLFLGGWLVGVAVVFGFAAVAGHLRILLDSFGDIWTAANSAAWESSHSSSNLLGAYLKAWTPIFHLAIKLTAIAAGFVLTCRLLERRGFSAGSLPMAALIAIPFLFWSFVVERWFIEVDFTVSLYSLALTGLVVAMIFGDRFLRIASLCGLLMIFQLPAGSDGAIYNAGPILLWLALPVAVTAFFRSPGITRYILDVPVKALVTLVSVTLLVKASLSLFAGNLYFDSRPVLSMTATVRAPHAEGLHTTPERAARFDRIFAAVSQSVSEGDTLLVYGSAPMINYLTGTLPALGCSWPELLTPDQLEQRLGQYPHSPYVMVLKFNTLGTDWGFPSKEFMKGTIPDPSVEEEGKTRETPWHNRLKSGIMFDFIEKNNYSIILDAEDFTLYKR